jgi:hypothetical protein
LCWVAASTGAAGAVISSIRPSWVGLPCWHLSCSFLSLIISSLSVGDYPYNRVNSVSTQIIPDFGDISQKIICVRLIMNMSTDIQTINEVNFCPRAFGMIPLYLKEDMSTQSALAYLFSY